MSGVSEDLSTLFEEDMMVEMMKVERIQRYLRMLQGVMLVRSAVLLARMMCM